MNTKFSLIIIMMLCQLMACAQKPVPSLVDYDAFEQLVKEVKKHREQHLLSLDDFLSKAQETQTIILDTRSKAMYDLKHIAGAVHLNFSDFTQQNLDSIMALYKDRNTQILIYCNNNFKDRTKLNFQDMAFITKTALPPASQRKRQALQPRLKEKGITLALNIPTYINLYGYGYKNVYELSELVDVNDPRIRFEGTYAQQQ